MTPGSMLGGRKRIGSLDSNDHPEGTPLDHKKFAEPVSLSSTASVDFPLAGTALGLGFDLLALRARRKRESRGSGEKGQGVEKGHARNLRKFHFSTFPQSIFQLVEKPVERL